MAAGCIPRDDLCQGRWLCKILRFAQDDIGKGWKDNGGKEGQWRGRKDKGGDGRTIEGTEGQWRGRKENGGVEN